MKNTKINLIFMIGIGVSILFLIISIKNVKNSSKYKYISDDVKNSYKYTSDLTNIQCLELDQNRIKRGDTNWCGMPETGNEFEIHLRASRL